MGRFYVNLASVDASTLAFLGYTLIRENDEFILYEDYAGSEYLVRKSDPFMYVDDMNDALYLNATTIANAPDDDD